MIKTLLIDDKRDISSGCIARTYDNGILLLTSCRWDKLLLDHDLGCFKNGKEMTGYDILCFLEEHPKYLPGKIELVTDNPVGRKKMQQVIDKLYD